MSARSALCSRLWDIAEKYRQYVEALAEAPVSGPAHQASVAKFRQVADDIQEAADLLAGRS